MQNTMLLRIFRNIGMTRNTRLAALSVAAAGTLLMAGCGTSSLGTSAAAGPVTGAAFQGHVFGGQQPVAGSTIQLYAASMIGYNLAAAALISSPVTTDANGNFSITGDYTCPYANTPVYITATGGNPGSGANANLVLMAPLGACGNLSASTFITINELTTVAGAYALSPFMSTPTQLSTSASNATGLSNAFATVNKLVNIAGGQLPGGLPTGATEPIAELNTLADILASCVNSNGVGGTSTNCSTLFTNATPSGGAAPTDTLTAMLNIAKNPGSNVSALYLQMGSSAPFQPTLTSAPNDFTVSVRYAPAGIFSSPSASALDVSGNLWVTNAGNNTIALLGATTGAPTVLTSASLKTPSGIAFDAAGNAWVPNKGSSTLSVFTPAGTGSIALSANLSSPTSVAIDGQGLIWVTDSGSNIGVTAVTVSGTTVTGSTEYTTGGINSPVAVAINPH